MERITGQIFKNRKHIGLRPTGIKQKELSSHLKKCPEKLVDCPFAEAGCKETVFLGQLTSSIKLHLVILMGAYREVKRRLEDLESASKSKPKKAKMSRF